MKKQLLCLIVLFSSSFVYSQVNIQWQQRYTSAGSNVDRAEDMVVDAAGNVYVTGLGQGTSGGFDYITIKYDNNGTELWVAQYNGPGGGLDQAHAIAVDAVGNVYVTGWSYGGGTTGFDYATVKYNSAGVQQWVARYNNTTNGTDEAFDVAVDNSGNVYVTGTSDGSGTNSAATTVKYNSAGAQQWANRFNGAGGGIDVAYAIFVDKVTGESYVTGYAFQSAAASYDYVTIKYNTAGAQQWATQYNGPDSKYDEARAIDVDASGNVYVTGYSQTSVLTNYDYATVKYNSAGVQQWAQRYNGTGNDLDRANAIKLDASGNVLVTGKSVGAGTAAEDIVTIKYNNAGAQQWLMRYNGVSNGYDEGKSVTTDALGAVYVTGYSFTTGANNDYTTIKYDVAGNQEWITKLNGTGNNADQAAAIGIDAIGNIYVSGLSRGAGSNEDYLTVKYCQLTANAGNDTTICLGSAAQLSASAIGAVAYAWLPNDGTLSSTTIANPTATPTVTTNYIVAITNTNGCTDYDTVVVTVVPMPSPVITPSGPTSFCIGGSVTLTSSVADSYQWSTSPNDTLSSITVNTSGTYTLTVATNNGCSAIATQLITVNALPTVDAGASDSICLSNTVNLQASGASTYVWHPGNSLSDSLVANPTAGPIATTTYTVVGTSAAGCVNSDVVTINVVGNPAIPTLNKINDTLYCIPATYAQYQWYQDGLPISGANGPTYTYEQNGTYYVEVFNAFGCSSVSVPLAITDVSITELSVLNNLTVFPNPSTGAFTIQYESSVNEEVVVNVYSLIGQCVYTTKMKATAGDNQIRIQQNQLNKGVYFIELTINSHKQTTKLVIQ
ncbi:MAG: SBBP repeat-containing protein [Bacteroidia bacterium]|nr:SBBP repeat-containing protein [Bacteroidia bacterium]